MLTIALLLSALNCPVAEKANASAEDWTEFDETKFEQTKSRCPVIYKASPCLILFIKKGYHNYNAICGKEI